MARYTLSEYYGTPHDRSNHVEFGIDLTLEQEQRLKDFLKRNGPCDYCCLEDEHPDLFDLINDAASYAVVADINSREGLSLEIWDVDWCGIDYDFYWDDGLLQ